MVSRGSNSQLSPNNLRRGAVGFYALAMMEREGAVHGYRVSEQIAQRTGGTWRPGPGAIYPALQRLSERGLARPRSSSSPRRREFEITAKGRSLLARIRSFQGRFPRTGPDLSPLWAEVAGIASTEEFLLLRMQRSLAAVEEHLVRGGGPPEREHFLRTQAERELRQFLARITEMVPGGPAAARPPLRRMRA